MANEKSPPKGNRRDFVRTAVPVAERLAGFVILVLLMVIGVAVAITGKHFNPDQYMVRTDSLKGTSAAVEGKAGTAPSEMKPEAAASKAPAPAPAAGEMAENSTPPPAKAPTAEGEGDSGGGESAPATTAAKPAEPNEPLEIALDGIKPMSATEFYNSDNLYEKIDGRAPEYQNFNVVAMRCRSFSVTAVAGSYVDVYEYKFDSPVDAFGMYGSEKDPKAGRLDFIADGYGGGMGYFFRQGAVYVQVIASDQKPETLALAKAIAQNRAKALPADDEGLAGRRLLPTKGMVDGSVAFVRENAQGLSALKNVYQARYKVDGGELPFFIMAATPDDAAKAWQAFQDFCKRFGKVEAAPDVNGGKIFRAQVFGKWKVVYQRGGELGGAYDAASADQANAFVEKYLRGEMK